MVAVSDPGSTVSMSRRARSPEWAYRSALLAQRANSERDRRSNPDELDAGNWPGVHTSDDDHDVAEPVIAAEANYDATAAAVDLSDPPVESRCRAYSQDQAPTAGENDATGGGEVAVTQSRLWCRFTSLRGRRNRRLCRCRRGCWSYRRCGAVRRARRRCAAGGNSCHRALRIALSPGRRLGGRCRVHRDRRCGRRDPNRRVR